MSICNDCKKCKNNVCTAGETYYATRIACLKFDAVPAETRKFNDKAKTDCYFWADLSK